MNSKKTLPRITLFFAFFYINLVASGQNLIMDWTVSSGGTTNDDGLGITVDNAGNVYVTGSFQGTVDFDPGPGFTSFTATNSDVFVCKYDVNGSLVWGKQLGGSLNDSGQHLTLDGNGNVIITGHFQGTTDFDPGSGTQLLTSIGGRDAFICKLDPGGNYLWAGSIGGTSNDRGFRVATDANNNIIVAGVSESSTFDFDPGPGVQNFTMPGGQDGWILKLSQAGVYQFAGVIGGAWPSNDVITSVAVDQSGNIFYIGSFQGTADLDPTATVLNFTSNGISDVFMTKVDPNGNHLWTNRIGGSSNDISGDIDVDNSGNPHITGGFIGTVDFDPGPATANLITPTSNSTVFVGKFDGSGNYLWAKGFGGGASYGWSLDIDLNGNVFTSGVFGGGGDFDPGPGVFPLSNLGGSGDAFISELDLNGDFVIAKGIGGSAYDYSFGVAVSNSGSVHMVGTFGNTVDFDPGADTLSITSLGGTDFFVEKFNQCNNSFDTVLQTACDVYNWPITGLNYSSTGTYTGTIPNMSGCDSVITLDLTINNNSTGFASITNCGPYIWNANNLTYTSSGIYVDTVSNINGCDSIVTLDLTIDPLPDASVTASSSYTLTSNQVGAMYQWVDCNNNFAFILGETSSSYTPVAEGSYAVIVSLNGCIDTSACTDIVFLGIDDSNSNFILYPNPTKDGNVTITFDESQKNCKLTLISSSGAILETKRVVNTDHINFKIDGSSGIYFLELELDSHKSTIRLVKN